MARKKFTRFSSSAFRFPHSALRFPLSEIRIPFPEWRERLMELYDTSRYFNKDSHYLESEIICTWCEKKVISQVDIYNTNNCYLQHLPRCLSSCELDRVVCLRNLLGPAAINWKPLLPLNIDIRVLCIIADYLNDGPFAVTSKFGPLIRKPTADKYGVFSDSRLIHSQPLSTILHPGGTTTVTFNPATLNTQFNTVGTGYSPSIYGYGGWSSAPAPYSGGYTLI